MTGAITARRTNARRRRKEEIRVRRVITIVASRMRRTVRSCPRTTREPGIVKLNEIWMSPVPASWTRAGGGDEEDVAVDTSVSGEDLKSMSSVSTMMRRSVRIDEEVQAVGLSQGERGLALKYLEREDSTGAAEERRGVSWPSAECYALAPGAFTRATRPSTYVTLFPGVP